MSTSLSWVSTAIALLVLLLGAMIVHSLFLEGPQLPVSTPLQPQPVAPPEPAPGPKAPVEVVVPPSQPPQQKGLLRGPDGRPIFD